ncbi:uncharacterized protein BDR25DRAFT_315607 [Lindgomyces ingoldianus]|uniref:Uncharacterized protein n=1 Tax=Lindgomyces ingoldianus TaxID=673940 RepID=A0ACB6QS74_9PLEO|nr:uncharacterized protein BDR25DRAFT_315607 [Lindgomyces ingoldianus]KAF2469152.1 hypothetical protein BDR25DRAFT_315607 [Lindgomyces ingoldianus]
MSFLRGYYSGTIDQHTVPHYAYRNSHSGLNQEDNDMNIFPGPEPGNTTAAPSASNVENSNCYDNTPSMHLSESTLTNNNNSYNSLSTLSTHPERISLDEESREENVVSPPLSSSPSLCTKPDMSDAESHLRLSLPYPYCLYQPPSRHPSVKVDANTFDHEAASILEPIWQDLDLLRRTTREMMPPSDFVFQVKSYEEVVEGRMHRIGEFIVGKVGQGEGREMEMEGRLM